MNFEQKMTRDLEDLQNSNDLMYLKRQLDLTEADLPCCAAESIFRTNKLGILRSRIAFLEKSK